MRRATLPVAILLACAIAGGCGQASRGSGANSHHPSSMAGYVIGDADDDDRHFGREPSDGDDEGVRDYGHAGTAAEVRAVTAVLERYYAAAAAGDGAAACALVSTKLSGGHELETFLPKEYRPAPGSNVLRGKGCASVESVLFDINRAQLALESATFVVTAVRVAGDHALAVLRFKTIGEREIALEREGTAWKVDALVDQSLL